VEPFSALGRILVRYLSPDFSDNFSSEEHSGAQTLVEKPSSETSQILAKFVSLSTLNSSPIHRCLLREVQREGEGKHVSNGTVSTRELRVDSDEQEQEAKPISGEPTYTTGAAARLLGVSTWYVNTRIASGELPTHRDERGRHLIPQEAVHALLEERRRAAHTRRTGLLRSVPSRAAQEAAQEEAGELRAQVEALQLELEQERRKGNELAEHMEALQQLQVGTLDEVEVSEKLK